MPLFSDLANLGDALAATKKKLERRARIANFRPDQSVEEIETIQRLRELI